MRIGYLFRKLGFRKIATMIINNDYGLGVKKVFVNEFKSLGGEITEEQTFTQGGVDFRAQLTKIKNSSPEAIYLVGYKEQLNIIKQLHELNINSQILGTTMLEDKEFIDQLGDLMEDIIYQHRWQ